MTSVLLNNKKGILKRHCFFSSCFQRILCTLHRGLEGVGIVILTGRAKKMFTLSS